MTGQKTWAIGEEVLATDFNNYVQSQVTAQFANAAARDAWSSPPNGALCVTLDDGVLWQRGPTAWRKPWASPWGRVGEAVAVADHLTFTTVMTAINGMSITFTAFAGRLYRVYFIVAARQNTANGVQAFQIFDGTTGASVIQRMGVAGLFDAVQGELLLSWPAGARTLSVRANVAAGSMDILSASALSGRIYVSDIGPTGVPV
jgi:hypothetical protein